MEDLRRRGAAAPMTEVDPAGHLATVAVRHYVAELAARFPSGFDPGDPPPLEVMTVVTWDDEPVACGGLQQIDLDDPRGVDEVKRMWVHPDWRGAGLGGRVLRRLEELAGQRGRGVVRLDTNGTLVEAIAMYERKGYRRIDRYNDNPYAEVFFEKTLS